MPELTPIPIPARQQWREFRVVVLPLITFSALVVMIGWLWVRYVAPATMIGEVETKRASIISTVAGVVQEIKVDRLATVTNGQPLAVIQVCDPDQLKAQIAAVEADLQLMKARMDLDKARNADSYINLRRQLEIEKLNLEVAKIHAVQSDGELARAKALYDSKLIPLGAGSSRNDFGYDVALRDHDSITATIASKERTIADLQAGLDRMKAAGATEVEATNDIIEHDIVAQRLEIEQMKKPLVLVSPINGFVSAINHTAGERITAGEKLLVVSAEKSHRIVAWVRQPVTERPQPGDIVSVRRATMGQAPFEGTVATVGKQLEEINPTAVPLTTAIQRAEFGLPLIVNVDANVDLIPGEAVQLRIIKRAAAN